MVTTTLDLVPDGQSWGLAFSLSNNTSRDLTTHILEPFLQYEIEVVTRDGSKLPIAQPAFNVQGQPRSLVLPSGATVKIETPIRLRFDPGAPPSGGHDPMVWSIRSPQQPVRVQATLELPGIGTLVSSSEID